jgi:hypothetical protein
MLWIPWRPGLGSCPHARTGAWNFPEENIKQSRGPSSRFCPRQAFEIHAMNSSLIISHHAPLGFLLSTGPSRRTASSACHTHLGCTDSRTQAILLPGWNGKIIPNVALSSLGVKAEARLGRLLEESRTLSLSKLQAPKLPCYTSRCRDKAPCVWFGESKPQSCLLNSSKAHLVSFRELGFSGKTCACTEASYCTGNRREEVGWKTASLLPVGHPPMPNEPTLQGTCDSSGFHCSEGRQNGDGQK